MTLSHRQSAFTLVEALALVALVAIVLPVVMYGLAQSTAAAGLVQQRAQAGEIASNQLTQIVINNEWQNGDSNGDVGDPPVVYHWQSHIQDWTQSNLHQIDVNVTWIGHGQQRTVSLSTLVYDGGKTQ